MTKPSILRMTPRTFAVSVVAIMTLVFAAACGDDSAPTPAAGAIDATPAAPIMTPVGTPIATPPAGMATGELGAVGTCIEENTDAEMVEDLRAGRTTAAEEVYTTCLEEVLPASVVADMEPIVQQAATCGQRASEDLTDDDVAALEAGDRTVAERLSAETLNCLSEETGLQLS
jgi:hypothetical protein